MSNSTFTKLFAEATNFKNEESSEKIVHQYYENTNKYMAKYDLNFLPDGTMTLNRTGFHSTENKESLVKKESNKFYRGTYEIVVNDDNERIIRLNIQFLKDISSSKNPEEKPFSQIFHFYTNKYTNIHSFTYLRNEIFPHFNETFSLENDKAFLGLEIAGETDELQNRNSIKKFTKNLLDLYVEKFPQYNILQGLNYLKEKINPDAVKDGLYKDYWEKIKTYLEENESIFLGVIAKHKGDAIKAYEEFDNTKHFKNFNKLLERLGDHDLKKHFESFVFMPFGCHSVNYTLVFYFRKTFLNKEFEEYMKGNASEKLEEETIYQRIFENSEKLKGTNLPNSLLQTIFKPELDFIREYGYDDEEKNLVILKNLFTYGDLPSNEEILKMCVDEYISQYPDYSDFKTYNIFQKKWSYPLYRKSNISEVKKYYLKTDHLQKFEFFVNLGFDEGEIANFLISQTDDDLKEIYDRSIYNLLSYDLRNKLFFIGKLNDYDFVAKVNKKEINLNDKIIEFIKSQYPEQVKMLQNLNFNDEEKNIEIFWNIGTDDLKNVNENTLYKKALDPYFYNEKYLISRYSKDDLKFYKSYLQSGKSNIQEFIKECILERFKTTIDEYVNLGFNDNEKNTKALLSLDEFEESTFAEKLLQKLIEDNYFEFSNYYKLNKTGISKNKKFFEKYFKSGDFDLTFSTFAREMFAQRLQEIKEYGFDNEEKNFSVFIEAYLNNYGEFTINNFIENLLKIYLTEADYWKAHKIGALTEKDFYKNYLNHNKDVYRTYLENYMPSMVPLLGKYKDSDYVVNIAKNLERVAKTPEEIESFIKKAYEYLKNVKNLIIEESFLIDHFKITFVCGEDLQFVFTELVSRAKTFITRKVIDVNSEKNSDIYKIKEFEKFYFQNEVILLQNMFEEDYHNFNPLLEKFSLPVCVYVSMKNCRESERIKHILEFIERTIIEIKLKFNVKPDENDIMLLLCAKNFYDDSFADYYQKLQELKPTIQEIKTSNPKLNDAFIVYTLMSD